MRAPQVRQIRQALNGVFQAAKRRARAFSRFSTIRVVIFLIAGKLDFSAINSHARATHLKFKRAKKRRVLLWRSSSVPAQCYLKR